MREADGDELGEDEDEKCSLLADDEKKLPPESAADDWCFMYDYGTLEPDDPVVLQLKHYAGLYGSLPDYELARQAIEFYDKQIFPTLDPDKRRQWTQRSFLRWADSIATAEVIRRVHLRDVQRKIELKRQTAMARRDRSGRVVDDDRHDRNTIAWYKLYYQIQAAGAKRR